MRVVVRQGFYYNTNYVHTCFSETISLVSLNVIAILTVTRIENYTDIFAKLILMDFERRKLVQLAKLVLHYVCY